MQEASSSSLAIYDGLSNANYDLFSKDLRTGSCLRAILDSAPVGITVARDCLILYANQKFLELYGYSDLSNVVGKPLTSFISTVSTDELSRIYVSSANEDAISCRKHKAHKDSSSPSVHVEVARIAMDHGSATVGYFCDKSDQKKAEDELLASRREKEVLLREVHHRVKNNLQVISSLLDLQASYIENEGAEEAFRETQNRIRSMSLVYEKLFGSQDLARINFKEYIVDLSRALLDSYGADMRGISLDIDFDEVFLGIDRLIPCGLIINELVSNSLKYAFTGTSGGTIRILFFSRQDGTACLQIADSGEGLPQGLEIEASKTLGLSIVSALVKQLRGSLEVTRHCGTEFRISFAI